LSKDKRYFPNLNGIRCIAAFLVVFHHLEQAKGAFGIVSFYGNPIVQHAGRLGVGLFFVLSGFLITYLLLDEKGRLGNVDAKKFYLRRVFRIWPIYFVIFGLSFFVFPHLDLLYFPGTNEKLLVHSTERIMLMALVLPNLAFVLYDLPYWCAQTWSIGVEEQFYYLWPWLIKYPKRRITIVVTFLAITAGLLFLGLHFLDTTKDVHEVILGTFIGQFRIQTMALGGLCAYLVYSGKTNILDFLFRKDVQIIVYLLLFILFFSGIHFFAFLEIYAIFFGFAVLNLSCNKNSLISFENPVMSYLGKISYGLYIYHVFVIVILINLMRRYFPDLEGIGYNITLYSLTVAGSVLVSALSYQYFEKPLLAYKDKRFGR
jgi:peptidoglycan/LPS O-acetylase OafA/YrhL